MEKKTATCAPKTNPGASPPLATDRVTGFNGLSSRVGTFEIFTMVSKLASPGPRWLGVELGWKGPSDVWKNTPPKRTQAGQQILLLLTSFRLAISDLNSWLKAHFRHHLMVQFYPLNNLLEKKGLFNMSCTV